MTAGPRRAPELGSEPAPGSEPGPGREPGPGSEPAPEGDLELAGERVRLRPLRAADRERLREIFAQPDVARWWGAPNADAAVDEWLEPDDDSVGFAIEIDGRVAGSIQYAEENEPEYRHAAVDLFLDGRHQGQGLGPDAIRTLARYLFEVRGHHRLTIDPAASNERAIRAYRRVGFQPVGIMRRYERGPNGSWHDGLLLDLLVDELT
ncbi:MAG TPA: GNAT family protein [Candidatus Eisenbacteria bacterium]|nr:GNAT family protein [Candidatus Eisenbacteria bacterium]